MLAFITLVVYLPTGWFGFIDFDDGDYVVDNPMVNHGLTGAGIQQAFTTFHSSNWHPLTWISHMVDCQLFGLAPGAHHLVNAIIHSANVALVFLWLYGLTGRTGAAAVIAALFGWHPTHVESVAWISERKDVLSTFFALLALLAYTRFGRENHRPSFWYALGFFALGLMAKPMLVTLPFLLLLLDFWPLDRMAWPASAEAAGDRRKVPVIRLVVEKWPFFGLTLISCALTFMAQKQGEAVIPLAAEPFGLRVENAVVSVANYAGKLLVPLNLAVFYPTPGRIPWWETITALLAVAAVSGLAWRWRRERPYLLVGWLWFLGTLVPVIGLVQVGSQGMADRYLYLPSIGFFMAAVFLIGDWVQKAGRADWMGKGLAVLVGVICIGWTEYQLRFWRDTEPLFRRAAAVTRDNFTAHLVLGSTLAKEKRYDEAMLEFQEADRLAPGSYQLHNDIGNVLEAQGRHAEAAAEYRTALALKPGAGYLHENLAKVLIETSEYGEARSEIAMAEQLDPAAGRPHAQMARLCEAGGQDGKAVAEWQKAVQLEPDNYGILLETAHFLAANENPAGRNGAAAVKLALRAGALSGNQPEAIDVLGMALAETGDYTNAEACAQSLLEAAASGGGGIENTNEIRARLERYQNHEPWRESFVATNLPEASELRQH